MTATVQIVEKSCSCEEELHYGCVAMLKGERDCGYSWI